LSPANASGGGELLLGRTTYELFYSYWPTPTAIKNAPIVAEGMNSMPKVVFSRTLDKASWNNTKLLKGDIVAETRKLQNEPGNGIAMVAELMPEPEALGLLALMLHAESRRRARRSRDGEYVPFAEQDTALWDGHMLEEAEALLRCACALGAFGRYQLEAGRRWSRSTTRLRNRYRS